MANGKFIREPLTTATHHTYNMSMGDKDYIVTMARMNGAYVVCHYDMRRMWPNEPAKQRFANECAKQGLRRQLPWDHLAVSRFCNENRLTCWVDPVKHECQFSPQGVSASVLV